MTFGNREKWPRAVNKNSQKKRAAAVAGCSRALPEPTPTNASCRQAGSDRNGRSRGVPARGESGGSGLQHVSTNRAARCRPRGKRAGGWERRSRGPGERRRAEWPRRRRRGRRRAGRALHDTRWNSFLGVATAPPETLTPDGGRDLGGHGRTIGRHRGGTPGRAG
ncbi:hypothetical protein PVAP13_3NG258049 [Panicum virgatum]|uniref:Uncharacterized protein n=1 Tax=Panicum virgatum TaxID=38727 RepID=A0A8T0U7W3_PANVG|nr:hypothetical protein PVAP13_3NG258049 [Panicum virgatum]